jgi:hypothetical protein
VARTLKKEVARTLKKEVARTLKEEVARTQNPEGGGGQNPDVTERNYLSLTFSFCSERGVGGVSGLNFSNFPFHLTGKQPKDIDTVG